MTLRACCDIVAIMASKKKPKAKKRAAFFVRVDPEAIRQFKIQAASAGMSLAKHFERLMLEGK